MNQSLSIAYVSNLVPLTRNLTSSDRVNVIGEKYCNAHNMVVLEDSSDQITIALAKESLLCLDELRKVLPREKKINAKIVEREQILKLFRTIYDLFDMNHCR
jgi:MshEN domain